MTDKAKRIEELLTTMLNRMEQLFNEKEYVALAFYSVEWKQTIKLLKKARECGANEDKSTFDKLITDWETFDKKVNKRFRRIQNGGAW